MMGHGLKDLTSNESTLPYHNLDFFYNPLNPNS